jgi:hypothetical protein
MREGDRHAFFAERRGHALHGALIAVAGLFFSTAPCRFIER